jgi:hypothetical protein
MERQFVAETLLRCRPDVVHAHWTYEHALRGLATGLPTVVTAHDAPLVALRHHLPTTSVGPLFCSALVGSRGDGRCRRAQGKAPYRRIPIR